MWAKPASRVRIPPAPPGQSAASCTTRSRYALQAGDRIVRRAVRWRARELFLAVPGLLLAIERPDIRYRRVACVARHADLLLGRHPCFRGPSRVPPIEGSLPEEIPRDGNYEDDDRHIELPRGKDSAHCHAPLSAEEILATRRRSTAPASVPPLALPRTVWTHPSPARRSPGGHRMQIKLDTVLAMSLTARRREYDPPARGAGGSGPDRRAPRLSGEMRCYAGRARLKAALEQKVLRDRACPCHPNAWPGWRC